jgi:hypothetical protein
MDLYPALLAHELTHVIHISRQWILPGNDELPPTWESEGLATFLEELVGHRVLGTSSGLNLGRAAYTSGSDWYAQKFHDLGFYFGFQSPTARVTSAPHECSWLNRPPNGPCLSGGRLPYGVPAWLYRYVADVAWGPSTEHQMTRAVVTSTTHGMELLSALATEDVEWLMAMFAIALATDDLYFSGGSMFSSWNLADVFGSFHPTARHTPQVAGYNSTIPFNVRGGSVAYVMVNGTHPEIAVAAGDLPSHMRLWIVRVE